jgi:hypothetical protein
MSSSSSSSESLSSASIAVCQSGERWLELTPRFQNPYLGGSLNGFRVRVEVTDFCNMEPEIFRYFRDTASGETVDSFTGVCSWADMENWPADTPRDTDCPPTFRLDYFDVVVPTSLIAADTWEKVQEEVTVLIAAMNAGDGLVDNVPVKLDGSA